MTTITKTDRNSPPVAGTGDLFLDSGKVDGRTTLARAYRSIFNDIATELGGSLSPAAVMMLKRVVTLTILCERAEAALVAGEAFDEAGYRSNVAALRAGLISLGLAKKSRDVTGADQLHLDQHTRALIGDE